MLFSLFIVLNGQIVAFSLKASSWKICNNTAAGLLIVLGYAGYNGKEDVLGTRAHKHTPNRNWIGNSCQLFIY